MSESIFFSVSDSKLFPQSMRVLAMREALCLDVFYCLRTGCQFGSIRTYVFRGDGCHRHEREHGPDLFPLPFRRCRNEANKHRFISFSPSFGGESRSYSRPVAVIAGAFPAPSRSPLPGISVARVRPAV